MFERCGVVLLGDDGPREPEWVVQARREGSRVEALDADDLHAIAPWFRSRSASRAWLLPDEGRIDVPRLVEGLARGAREAGVRILTSAPVRSLHSAGGSVRGVELASGEVFEARQTVLAAGGHVTELARSTGSRVSLAAMRPTRRHIAVTGVDPRIDPAGPVVWDERTDFYARPVVAAADGGAGGWLTCACDTDDLEPHDVRPDPPTDAARLAELEVARGTHLPDFAAATVERAWAGVRTLSADEASVIGPDPHVPGLFWVAALGGHGMSTSIATGEVAADLLCDRTVDPQLAEALAPGRFVTSVRAR